MDTSKSSPKTTSPKITQTTWATFNHLGADAGHEKIYISDANELPLTIGHAIRVAGRTTSGLDPIGVNWNITCVAADGQSLLKKMTFFGGGSRSGSTCGEDGMWAAVDKNNKSTPIPLASAYFSESSCIYVIDAGLCPCLRCCKALLGLATRTNSTILVRPMTDYEILARDRTTLRSENLYVLVFSPNQIQFKLYHNLHLGPRDVTQDPTRAWFQCLDCKKESTVVFPSAQAKRDEIKRQSLFGFGHSIEYQPFKCKRCESKLIIVEVAEGDFPLESIPRARMVKWTDG